MPTYPASQEAPMPQTTKPPFVFYHSEINGISDFVPLHCHSRLELLYFRRGRFRLELDLESLQIEDETFVFLNANELHSISCLSFGMEDAIVFDPIALGFDEDSPTYRLLLQPLSTGHILLPRRIPHGHILFEPLQKEFEVLTGLFQHNVPQHHFRGIPAEDDLITQLYIRAALLRILGLLQENAMPQPSNAIPNHRFEMLQRSLNYIEEHYTEEVSLPKLAEAVGINHQYFCRFIKAATGYSPIEYVNMYRARRAVYLLSDDSLSVDEIGRVCGFRTTINFTRAFVRYFGTTPLRYRRQHLPVPPDKV